MLALFPNFVGDIEGADVGEGAGYVGAGNASSLPLFLKEAEKARRDVVSWAMLASMV